MELDENIRKDLKCSNCENYLTCTPIMVKPNGDSLCGRCSPLKEEKHLVVRNNAYEKVASGIIFPCRYQKDGCSFSSSTAELEEHELHCEYHKFKCPVLPFGSCPWVGSRQQLVEHFKKDHSDLFLQHPCNVKPNVTKNCEKNMLTSIANKLFLVQIKYNVSSAKFWHSVRLIDNPKLTKHYEYNFEILSEKGNLFKKWDVLEQEFFQFYDDPQKEIDLNGLLSVLGRYDNLIFQITIIEKEHVVRCADCKISLSVADVKGAFCVDCSKITVVENSPSVSIKCNKTAQGCSYNDKDINVRKHEMWFCEFAENVCTICSANVNDLFDHCFTTHRGDIHNEVMRKENLSLKTKYSAILILNDVIFLCLWSFNRSNLEFKVISNISKTDNEKFDCILKMINPRNKFQKKYKLTNYKNTASYDWLGIIKSDLENPIIGLITETVQPNVLSLGTSNNSIFGTASPNQIGFGSSISALTPKPVHQHQQERSTSVHSRYSFELNVIRKS